jgi:hypothetical protein
MSTLFGDITAEMINAFNELYKKGNKESLELALKKLKQIGCTQMQSAKLLISVLGLSIREADKIVLNAEAWKGEKAGNMAIQEEFTTSKEEDSGQDTE